MRWRAGIPVAALTALVVCACPAAAQAPDADVLARPVSLAVRDAPLGDVLFRLRHLHAAPLAWSGDIIPTDHRVTLSLDRAPLGEVLDAVLAGSGLRIVVTSAGSIVIVPALRPAAGAAVVTRSGPEAEAVSQALLATGVRQLDEVIVMGTAVAGAPEREQPTAVGVVGAAELAGAAHTGMADLMRTLLPGVVLWDAGPGGGPPTVTAVRGVSSFTSRGLKSFVDGVELASADFFPLVDGRGVERIEVIRGPQGAALYGPEALNGIMQVETAAGQPGTPGWRGRLAATGGPYEPGGSQPATFWQDHAAGVSAATEQWGAEVGGSWSQGGDRGAVPWQRVLTAQGGTTVIAGPVTVRATARVGQFEYGLARPGSQLEVSAPQEVTERAVGVTLVHALSSRWRQTLVVGHHRVSGPRDPLRSFLLDPRLPLGATHETASRRGARYATAVDLRSGERPWTLSAGVEHGARELTRSVRRTAGRRDLTVLFADELQSTGIHGQLRARIGSHLVLTGGTRAEWSSTVGVTDGAVWASSAGASWSQPVGRAVVRVRGAWGRGLRPPEPGMNRAMATATVRQEANDELAPERQSGIELGADLYLPGGMWIRATGYDQRADDLIQQVRLRGDGAVQVFQFQNVGAIRNRGVELEAGAPLGTLTVSGVVYLTSSTILRTAPGYRGDLEPGDPLPEVPSSVGSLQVRYARGAFTIEAGASWLGAWTGYDRARALEEEGMDSTTPQLPRDYWIRYPAVVRPWIAAAWEMGKGVSLFLRADNPGRSTAFIRDNLSPGLGRTTVVGVTLVR